MQAPPLAGARLRAALPALVEESILGDPLDCVLVAGRGHEPFQQIGHERIALDDGDVVRRYLYNLAPSSPYGALASVSNS